MAYAKIVKKGVLVREEPFDGAKPLVNSYPEQREGFKTTSAYVDEGDVITVRWTYTEMTEEEKRESEAYLAPVDDCEAALTRYANELTGAEDETLTEATETLIKQLKEDK